MTKRPAGNGTLQVTAGQVVTASVSAGDSCRRCGWRVADPHLRGPDAGECRPCAYGVPLEPCGGGCGTLMPVGVICAACRDGWC
jgi:hypothetical protein